MLQTKIDDPSVPDLQAARKIHRKILEVVAFEDEIYFQTGPVSLDSDEIVVLLTFYDQLPLTSVCQTIISRALCLELGWKSEHTLPDGKPAIDIVPFTHGWALMSLPEGIECTFACRRDYVRVILTDRSGKVAGGHTLHGRPTDLLVARAICLAILSLNISGFVSSAAPAKARIRKEVSEDV